MSAKVSAEAGWTAAPADSRKLKLATDPIPGDASKYGAPDIHNIVNLLMAAHPNYAIPISAILDLQTRLDEKQPNIAGGSAATDVLFWNASTGEWGTPKRIQFQDIDRMPTPPNDQASDDKVLQAQWNSGTSTLEYKFKAFTVGNQILSVLPLPLNNTKLENIETKDQIWTLHVGRAAPGTSGNLMDSLAVGSWYFCTSDNELYKRTSAATTGSRGWVRQNSRLTVNRALVSDGSGKVAVSAITATELGRLDGVTSSVQTQLNGKEPLGARTNIDRLQITGTSGDVLDNASSSRKRFFRFFRDANPVNYFRAKASNTGSALELKAEGSDANISINVKAKGTGYLIGSTETMMFPLSDEENEFDAGVKYTVRLPHTIKVLAPYACLTVAPGASKTVEFDVMDDGTSIFTTRPSITGTGTYSTGTLNQSRASIARNSKIEFKVHSITDDSAARGAKVGFRTLVQ